MITQAIFSVFKVMTLAIIDVISVLIPPVPAFVGEGLGYLTPFIDKVYEFDTWVPVTYVATVAGVVFSVYLVGLVIGVIRVVLSYFTFGGNT